PNASYVGPERRGGETPGSDRRRSCALRPRTRRRPARPTSESERFRIVRSPPPEPRAARRARRGEGRGTRSATVRQACGSAEDGAVAKLMGFGIKAKLSSKRGGKITGIAVADAGGRFEHGGRAGIDQTTGFLQATPAQITEDGRAENTGEGPLERGFAQADALGKLRQAGRRFEFAFQNLGGQPRAFGRTGGGGRRGLQRVGPGGKKFNQQVVAARSQRHGAADAGKRAALDRFHGETGARGERQFHGGCGRCG